MRTSNITVVVIEHRRCCPRRRARCCPRSGTRSALRWHVLTASCRSDVHDSTTNRSVEMLMLGETTPHQIVISGLHGGSIVNKPIPARTARGCFDPRAHSYIQSHRQGRQNPSMGVFALSTRKLRQIPAWGSTRFLVCGNIPYRRPFLISDRQFGCGPTGV